MSLATISVNFASISEVNTGTINNKSLSPSVLKTFLTQGTAIGYALSVNTATFSSNVNYNTLTTNAGVGLFVNTNALRIDATNNRVGINTPTPLDRLHISQSAGDFILYSTQRIGHDGTGPYIRLGGVADQFRIANASISTFVTISTTGVGINKSPAAGYALDVAGNISATAFTGNGADLTDIITPGAMFDYAGSTAPAGWLLCNGQAATGYPALIAFLNAAGNPFGTSGGIPLVPNITNRISIGAGAGAGLTSRTLGSTGGQETVQLTASQSGLPAHTHLFPGPQGAGGAKLSGSARRTDAGADNSYTSCAAVPAANAAAAHNNLMPFIVINKIIRAI